MKINSTQLSATSRLFSSTVIRELASKGKSALFARLIGESCLDLNSTSLGRVADAFDAALGVLRAGSHRDEYVYKSALTEKILFGRHSLKTACMLTEFRVGTRKADLAILNGSATVYEIKSERDSLSRLDEQLKAYRNVFSKVYVVAGENHVDAVLAKADPDIGVLLLSKRHQISSVREATYRADLICPLTILDSIRTPEAAVILRELGEEVPNVPNTAMRTELRHTFSRLDPEQTHDAMVKTLKRTRNLQPLESLVSNLPNSLQAAALTVPLRRADHARLVGAVQTDLHAAMRWA